MKVRKYLLSFIKLIISIFILSVTLFPFYSLVLMAILPSEELKNGMMIIPSNVTFDNFTRLFNNANFGVALKNSLINSLAALLFSIGFGLATAYVLARRRFSIRIKKPLTGWVLLVRVLPPVAFVIPLYTMFSKLGLLETRMPIILACVLINIPLIIWFMISFFSELPEEVEESGKIDGANEWQLFYKVVLPLVLPGIAAVAMLSFIYAWNEYTYSIIFTRSPSNYTIPLALAVLNTEDNITDFGLVSSGGIISFLPIMLFVIFAQNYLISGLSSGAVKE